MPCFKGAFSRRRSEDGRVKKLKAQKWRQARVIGNPCTETPPGAAQHVLVGSCAQRGPLGGRRHRHARSYVSGCTYSPPRESCSTMSISEAHAASCLAEFGWNCLVGGGWLCPSSSATWDHHGQDLENLARQPLTMSMPVSIYERKSYSSMRGR